jgi:aminopeptidase N
MYTIFATSQWLVCNDIPGDRSTLELHLVLPAGLTVLANGDPIQDDPRSDGKVDSVWREPRALPAYTLGFAVGPFTEVTADRGRLRFLGVGFSDTQLQQIFHDTADILAFYEERSGVRYGGGTYSQALVADAEGQELGDFALMSGDYGQEVLADPSKGSLIAHELAHQWWGNRVTCRDWTDFWLNEGFATFMTAAYLEKRSGHEAYLDRVGRWREQIEKLKQDGHDHALVYADWNHPSSADRTVVYQKGAYVLHLLRQELGDDVFWKGIRNYTRQHMDKSVVTADFKTAMERSSGRDLAAFFNSWVYGTGGGAPPATPPAK